MSDFFQARRITLTSKNFALLLGLILGGFIRWEPVLTATFPIKDGGLFFVFISEIQQNQFSLPTVIAYNGLSIPFAYPPLSFYLTAIISFLIKIPSFELIKILPAIFSIVTIAAFYWLASTILESDRQVCFAVISFSLLPTAVDFMIVGGGLPRSIGYFFALLALRQIWLLFTQYNKTHLGWSILWTGLTFLSHPVVAWFLVYSMAVIFLFTSRTRKGLLHLLWVALGVILLTSPWWLLVISRHGITPFLNVSQAAPQSWTSYLAAFLFMQTNEPYLHIQGFLALIGLFVCLNNKKFILPSWLAAVFLLEPRLVASYTIIPAALLVGIGIDFLAKSLSLLTINGRTTPDQSNVTFPDSYSLTKVSKIMLGFFLTYAIVSAFVSTPRQYLSTENREAMAWIKNNLPQGSNFLVISGIYGAGEDYVAEWFPVLTDSVSLSTPQGMEWFPNRLFATRWQSHDRLQECVNKDVGCLDEWAKNINTKFSYVYISKIQDPHIGMPLLINLTHDPNYTMVFENREVVIFSANR